MKHLVFVIGSMIPAIAYAEDVPMKDLPEPVRTTLEREAKGATIEDIEREHNADGSVYYEIEIERGDEEWQLHIAPTGEVIQRKVDH